MTHPSLGCIPLELLGKLLFYIWKKFQISFISHKGITIFDSTTAAKVE